MSNVYYPAGVTDADIERHFGGNDQDSWDRGNLICYHDDAWRKAEDAGDEGRTEQLENKTVFDGEEVVGLSVWYDRHSALVRFTCPLCGVEHEQEFDLDD